MRFVIVGPGALGSVIAARLVHSGHDVSLLGRPSPHLDAILARGLRLETRSGATEQLALPATDDPAVVSAADVVIVLVKSGETATAMRAIRRHLRDDHTLLTLQNGLGNAERIRAEIGPGPRLLVGVTSQAAMRLAPGSVAHTGEGPTFIGFLDENDAAIASKIARLLAAAGLPAVVVPDIARYIWQKLAVNAAINGLTALAGVPNGLVATDAGLCDAAEIIAEEVASVARERGFELGGMRRAIVDTALATAHNRSSMLQDLDAGRTTEVEAIHGAVVAAGQAAGIATPATQALAALIRVREREKSKVEPDDA